MKRSIYLRFGANLSLRLRHFGLTSGQLY